MRTLRHAILGAIAAAAIAAPVRAQAPTGDITIGRADSIFSPTLNEWRRYLVYTPPGYAKSPYLPRAYPVIYLLDGDAHFHSLTGLLQFYSTGINATYVIPEMIVVAIPNTDRTRDLTPTHSTVGPDGVTPAPFPTSGGGPNFLKFIRSELMPHVDSTYRTEPFRVLIGHSLGGITAVSALYTMPDAFNAYIAIDPSMWWDRRTLVKQAPAFFSSTKLATRTLYVAQANTVDLNARGADGPCAGPSPSNMCADSGGTAHFRAIAEFGRLAQVGAARSGLRYAFKYYPGDDHGSVPLGAEMDGLRFIFASYKMPLFPAKPSAAAIASHFAALSTEFGYPMRPPEKFIVGITQAAAGIDAAWATGIGRYAVELYPTSPRAFEALGAALLAAKDSSGARTAYARSFALDSTATRVRDLLAKLKP